jgi:hypothetical protein
VRPVRTAALGGVVAFVVAGAVVLAQDQPVEVRAAPVEQGPVAAADPSPTPGSGAPAALPFTDAAPPETSPEPASATAGPTRRPVIPSTRVSAGRRDGVTTKRAPAAQAVARPTAAPTGVPVAAPAPALSPAAAPDPAPAPDRAPAPGPDPVPPPDPVPAAPPAGQQLGLTGAHVTTVVGDDAAMPQVLSSGHVSSGIDDAAYSLTVSGRCWLPGPTDCEWRTVVTVHEPRGTFRLVSPSVPAAQALPQDGFEVTVEVTGGTGVYAGATGDATLTASTSGELSVVGTLTLAAGQPAPASDGVVVALPETSGRTPAAPDGQDWSAHSSGTYQGGFGSGTYRYEEQGTCTAPWECEVVATMTLTDRDGSITAVSGPADRSTPGQSDTGLRPVTSATGTGAYEGVTVTGGLISRWTGSALIITGSLALGG